jgi:hypothetical protein
MELSYAVDATRERLRLEPMLLETTLPFTPGRPLHQQRRVTAARHLPVDAQVRRKFDVLRLGVPKLSSEGVEGHAMSYDEDAEGSRRSHVAEKVVHLDEEVVLPEVEQALSADIVGLDSCIGDGLRIVPCLLVGVQAFPLSK